MPNVMYKFLKIALIFTVPVVGFSQTIQFSVYVQDELVANQESDMDFASVVAGQGLTQINIGDQGMGVFSVTGNEDLDVIVTLTPPTGNQLTQMTETDVIPFTLEWAYANHGENNINDAVYVTGNSARFRMKARGSGPPGPPPNPQRSNYTPKDATAYIYIFGSIDVGNIAPGHYTGTVTLTVEYD